MSDTFTSESFQPVFWAGYEIDERNWHMFPMRSYADNGYIGLDATVSPDEVLQSFERGDLAVAGNEPTDISSRRRELFVRGAFDPDRSSGGGGAAPGTAQFGDELLDFGVVGTASKKCFGAHAGEREKCFEHEIDGGGGAFDVEEQGADVSGAGEGQGCYPSEKSLWA